MESQSLAPVAPHLVTAVKPSYSAQVWTRTSSALVSQTQEADQKKAAIIPSQDQAFQPMYRRNYRRILVPSGVEDHLTGCDLRGIPGAKCANGDDGNIKVQSEVDWAAAKAMTMDLATEHGVQTDHGTVYRLAKGVVIIKDALNKAEQINLAEVLMADGGSDGGHSFYLPETIVKDGPETQEKMFERKLNSEQYRGRIYDTIDSFAYNPLLKKVSQRGIGQAREMCPVLPEPKHTHVLIHYYCDHKKGPNRMGWHAGNGRNDGANENPICSVSLGNQAVFGIRRRPEDPCFSEYVLLESGDVMVWGGPARLLVHCVHMVRQSTGPDYLHKIMGDARINLTFRSSPEVAGREDTFKYFAWPDEHKQHIQAIHGEKSAKTMNAAIFTEDNRRIKWSPLTKVIDDCFVLLGIDSTVAGMMEAR